MAKIGGTVEQGDGGAGVTFGRRVAEVRAARNLSQAGLARKIRDHGGVGRPRAELVAGPLSRERIAKIETQPERAARVTVEEAFAIAWALDCSPLYLFAPIDHAGGPRVAIMGSVQPVDSHELRAWLRGEEALTGQDPLAFAMTRPVAEIPAALEGRFGALAELQARYTREER